jgi:hypothetical protein
MADGMITLLQNQQMRNQIISEGKAWVAEQFDNKKWLVHLADLFKAEPHIYPK